ncbi:MAG: hypothetical protein JRF59_08795 [Deltaproteobacteria bacterium]|nr:hypothetical protein [Deltaproteobacteria bacterium]MBW1923519.1 hypothetical protein [Deltaproteobacteria bacterium]MBW1950246.1 hypothetical protein [Deltaproteobacteria bacterium]MBW2008716.1 hypothetical protein [Deltaproteobacteria bacterium]MBW2101366.1 hypothetical protein [Deltaproteobacteria bacterium]
MKDIVRHYLEALEVGPRQAFRNLALFPLLSAATASLDYLLLEDALAQGLVEVLEKDEEGAVPELKVVNRSPSMVLILDGEELVGAKQNRVVNTTILIMGKTTTVIPVSCVEQGRWSYRARNFETQGRMLPQRLRAGKARQVNESVRAFGKFRSDQIALWDGIAEQAERRSAHSPTGAMASIYEKELPNLQEFTRHFSPVEGQVGAVFLINGEVAGLDAFGKQETFSRAFSKLLPSYALDGLDLLEPGKKHRVFKRKVSAFLRASCDAPLYPHPSVGVGTDVRMESEDIAGFALVLGKELVHVSSFPRETKGGFIRAGMRSYSQRRRNRGL